GGDAEAGGERDRLASGREDLARSQHLAHALGDRDSAGRTRTRQDQGKLLAAPSARGVDVAHHLVQRLPEHAQHVIAAQMAELVVDRLEALEAGEHEAYTAAEALRARDLFLEALLERAPVREPGQRIDERLPLDDVVKAGIVECNRGLRSE